MAVGELLCQIIPHTDRCILVEFSEKNEIIVLSEKSSIAENNLSAASGALSLNSDGSFSYTPGSGFSGSDSFAYHVEGSDGGGGTLLSNTVTVSLTVNAANSAPVADAVNPERSGLKKTCPLSLPTTN